MTALLQDLRYGLRGLRKNPAFAAIAILSLALGIGATTAMFSLVYAVVLDAYPYADHQRTVNPIVRDVEHPKDWDWFTLTPAQATVYRQTPAFEDILGLGGDSYELRGQDLPEDVRVTYLTPNDATFNRVPALIGRGIQPSDDGKHNVAVLSYKFWLRRFNGDRGIIGRNLQLSNRDFTVVGVMPQRFTVGTPDIYVPSTLIPTPNARMGYFAKLKPGVTAEQASAQVEALVHQFAKEDPRFYPKNFHVQLQYLIDPVTKGTGGSPGLAHTFPLIFLAVVMLLLIGCANCSILLLARGTARTHEFAVRSAVGATRGRIIRQLLVECLVISFAGAALGVALSYFLAKLPLQLLPSVFPTESLVRVNLPVLAFSVVVATLAGVLFGLLPALRFSRPNISETMQASARRNTGSKGARATLNTLIAGQIALTLVLLAVAGAAIAGFMAVLRMHLGYDPTNTILIAGPITKGTLPGWQERTAYIEQLGRQIATTPGVMSVGSGGPPPNDGWKNEFTVVGRPTSQKQITRMSQVTDNYFSLLHVPLLHGRVWNETENRQGLPLAVVNESFAKRYLAGADPIGQQIEMPMFDEVRKETPPPGFPPPAVSPALSENRLQIVGVVADVINDGLDKPIAPAIYIPSTSMLFGAADYLVHTQGDPLASMRAIQASIHTFNPNQKLWSDPYTLERMIHETPEWGQQRLISVLFGIFAAAALALAIVGLYSVVAFAVAQRTGEFGIRMALGAQRASILSLVVRSTLHTVLGGTALGLLLAALLRHEAVRWSENSSQSPLILAGAALLLVVAALVASIPPARRAAAIDPMQALRSE